MKLSHIIVKVKNLEKAVIKYRNNGFAIEFGRTRDPENAIIYFSEGPYLELRDGSRMSAPVKLFNRLTGKGAMIDRLQRIDDAEPGNCDLALENYREDLDEEKAILKKYGKRCCGFKYKRIDTYDRDLSVLLVSPADLSLPFLTTSFEDDPRPVDFVHPNGTRCIKRVTFGTSAGNIPIIEALCDDDRLVLTEGDGIDFEFEVTD